MSARVIPAAPRLRGEVVVPGDKSISHRALVLAALATGASRLTGRARGGDQDSMVACLRRLGVEVADVDGVTTVQGVGLRGLRPPGTDLDCGNSGATMRFLAGAELQGADIELDVPSAQVKTALLLAALQAEGVTTLHERLLTRDHTERLLKRLGVDLEVGPTITLRPPTVIDGFELAVAGDASSAAFWAVLASCHPDAEVVLRGVCLNPTRAGFLSVLGRMGARIAVENRRDQGGEAVGDLVIRSTALVATDVAAGEIPSLVDEVPVLALAACLATGTTAFRGLGELRHKEVDRLDAISAQLGALGAGVEVAGDDLHVTGPTVLRGAMVSALGDHRMAMTLALAGALASGETAVEGAAVAEVSYPSFFHELERLASADSSIV